MAREAKRRARRRRVDRRRQLPRDTRSPARTRGHRCVSRHALVAVRPTRVPARLPNAGRELPEGCDYSAWLRLRDEWRLAVRIWRKRRSEPEREHEIISQHGQHVALHVLRSKRAVQEFLDALDADTRKPTTVDGLRGSPIRSQASSTFANPRALAWSGGDHPGDHRSRGAPRRGAALGHYSPRELAGRIGASG